MPNNTEWITVTGLYELLKASLEEIIVHPS